MTKVLGDQELNNEIQSTSKSVAKDAGKRIKSHLLSKDTLGTYLEIVENQYAKIASKLYSALDESTTELVSRQLELKSGAEQKLSTLSHETDKLRSKYKDYLDAAEKAGKDISGEESSLVKGADANRVRLEDRLKKVTIKKDGSENGR